MAPPRRKHARPPLEKHAGKEFEEAFDQSLQDLGQVNVLVIGSTGTGKSTLINAFFVGDPAATGVGRPVTTETTYYTTPNGLLGIFDTKGIEFGESRTRITGWIKDEVHRNSIDVAWFCVRAADARIDETQLAMIRTLTDALVPVVVVFTQVSRRSDGLINPSTISFVEQVEHELRLAGAKSIILLAAKADDWSTPTVHGLKDLLHATQQLLTDTGSAAAFDAVQDVDWELKRRKARSVVAVAASTAAGIAAAPVPLSDSVGIIPVQIGMLASVAAIYGVPATVKQLTVLAGPVIVGGGVAFVGKTLFKAILKAVPGANFAVGVVAASVAASITYALGEAWMWTCAALCKRGSVIDVDLDKLREEFVRNYKNRMRLGSEEAA